MKRWYTLLFAATLVAAVGTLAGTCGAGKGCGAAKACGAGDGQQAKALQPGIINPAGVAALLAADAKAVILDARSGKYDDGRRLPGARSLTDKSTPGEVTRIIPSKDSLVITYCANPKCPASNRLAKHLNKLGYRNILEMPEGIEGWADEGRAIETVN